MSVENENFDRKMEFLLEAQARASAQIEKLAEGHVILTRSMVRLSEGSKTNRDRLEATIAVMEHLAERVDAIGQKIEDMAQVQKSGQEESNKRFQAMDDRLNVLMNVVEGHISGSGHQHPM